MERSEYVEQRNGGFYVAGTRVAVDSMEQLYGAIAFYLAHEREVELLGSAAERKPT